MLVRCHKCSVCIFTTVPPVLLSNKYNFESPVAAQWGTAPRPFRYPARLLQTAWLSEVARWNESDPLHACPWNGTKKTGWSFIPYCILKNFDCKKYTYLNKDSGKKYVVMHLNILRIRRKKCAPCNVQRYLFGFVAWDLRINASWYPFQQPELPDLPTVSLPIRTSALPTFSFTSPLPASTISNTSSVTVTPVKEVLTVMVCVHLVNSLN